MKAQNKRTFHLFFGKCSDKVTKMTGSPMAFLIAAGGVIVWLVSGPVFHYSDTWQLIINTSTTIVTFLMVFLIQQSQNKDTRAIHLKLDELISATQKASNQMINIEDKDEDDLDALKETYAQIGDKLKSLSKNDNREKK